MFDESGSNEKSADRKSIVVEDQVKIYWFVISRCEIFNKDNSSKRFDKICNPNGIPLLCLKSGREMAGTPTRLANTV